MKHLAILALLFATTEIAAARPTTTPVALQRCDAAGVGVEHLVPGAANQRTAAGGKLTLYRYDRGEPVSVPQGLAIVYDRGEDRGGVTCVIVGDQHSGFFRVDLSAATESTAAGGTITLAVPVTHYEPDGKHRAGAIELAITSPSADLALRARVR